MHSWGDNWEHWHIMNEMVEWFQSEAELRDVPFLQVKEKWGDALRVH